LVNARFTRELRLEITEHIMPISLTAPEAANELKPQIVVIGVGGAGGNAINNMIEKNLEGVDFVAANTDAQALSRSLAKRRVQLGAMVTQGLGAGAQPEIGAQAAEDSLHEILEHLDGAHMVFITAGMGGGTGTGAAPVIARIARERGILTVGVVTKPFQFEGPRRMRMADAGVAELEQHVDTLIVIPNQNLFRVATETTSFADAFVMADDVLHSGVRAITDLIVRPGIVNRDFADVSTTMRQMGRAMIGMGEAEGDRRAAQAAEAAINNPLLDDTAMKGAQRVLISFTHGPDFTLHEIDEASNIIAAEADEDAQINWGSTLDESMMGKVRLSVIATGIGGDEARKSKPIEPMRPVAKAAPRPAPRPSVLPWRDETSAPRPVTTVVTGSSVTPHVTVSQPAHAPAAMQPFEESVRRVTPASAPVQPVNAPAPAASHNFGPLPEHEEAVRRVVRATAPMESAAEYAAEQASAQREPDIDPEPAIRRLKQRVEEAAPAIRRPAGNWDEPETREEPRRTGFSLFRRRAEPEAEPVQARPAVRVSSGDLFRELDGDDLEIPAFLRRQAN
jgi:cell division protein FtsZ